MLKELIKSWTEAMFPTEEQAARAERNLSICMECPSKKDEPFLHCGECGCPLKAKVFSNCPIGKFSRE